MTATAGDISDIRKRHYLLDYYVIFNGKQSCNGFHSLQKVSLRAWRFSQE